ncbi:hypothetical protein EVAR_91979_1 [Eumeta japonica]|uniref:Uncharacterized protein n=1 Tax=Eumeta variegata TaxID=151549 RepID=A0A4C2AF18_EUMVA|nr:hypothetical protein EVAR_91979_1 [Eumeta japonica]
MYITKVRETRKDHIVEICSLNLPFKEINPNSFGLLKIVGVSTALVREPYTENTGFIKQHPGTRVIRCTANRDTSAKAAIIVSGDRLEVIQDPQLVGETEAAAVVLVAGGLK